MNKLSVVLATYNEEANLKDCLSAVKDLASEIIIVDGSSTDKTAEIAREFGAQVYITDNPPIFHINKQKALDLAKNEWILQLDADELVTSNLAKEIQGLITMEKEELEKYQQFLPKKKLFDRHQRLVEEREGSPEEKEGEYVAFYIPRLNFFLGKYLKYGGVYPDGVIRLVKKGKARFPCKDVHEQIEVDGRSGWLANDLLHMADISFKRYLTRNSRYIDLIAKQLREQKLEKNVPNFLNYTFLKPVHWFFLTQIRHKGILDGWQGIVFSFFSALRFPRAYFRYLRSSNSKP